MAYEKRMPDYEEIGLLCLWFLRKCLMFEQIPSGIMTYEEKNTIICNFLCQIIETTFIKRLSDFNFKVFLETYLLIFVRRELSEMIREYN